MFEPGQSGNPKGRPPGSKNKVTLELFKIAKERGFKHPVLYLIEVVNDEKAAPERRDTCAIAAAPYMTHKMGTATLPRYLEEPVEVPVFATVQQAEDYLANIPVLLGRGELDSQSALELSSLTKNWLDAIYSRQDYELKLSAQGGTGDTTIRIEGGLPQLPGTSIATDPDGRYAKEPTLSMNGHNGHVIEHDVSGQVVAPVLPQDSGDQANPLDSLENISEGTL